MNNVTPMSEDFFYWNPEEICYYPHGRGVEERWFNSSRQNERKQKQQVKHKAKGGNHVS